MASSGRPDSTTFAETAPSVTTQSNEASGASALTLRASIASLAAMACNRKGLSLMTATRGRRASGK